LDWGCGGSRSRILSTFILFVPKTSPTLWPTTWKKRNVSAFTKGKGVRRAEVRKRLAAESRVLDFFDAPPVRGGTGATVVLLGPIQNPKSKIQNR
jgi:hypothetical protein